MLKKTIANLIQNNLYKLLLKKRHTTPTPQSAFFTTISSLQMVPVDIIKNTGHFFPGLTLFFLGLSILPFNKFYKLTLKSTIFST